MRSVWAPVLMMITGIMFLLAFIMYNFFSAPKVNRQNMKVLKCSNAGFDIAMMIDLANDEFYIAGQKVPKDQIETINQMAIKARWPHSNGYTHIFLDRVNGKAELTEYGLDGTKGKQDELDCQFKGTEF